MFYTTKELHAFEIHIGFFFLPVTEHYMRDVSIVEILYTSYVIYLC